MKKFTALAFVCAMSASQFAFASETCLYNESKTNWTYTPDFDTRHFWNGGVSVTNISNKTIRVRWELTSPVDGSTYIPVSPLYESNFNANNTPVGANNWATLEPGQMGKVLILDDNTSTVGVGKLIWESDFCLNHAVFGSFETSFWQSTTGALSKEILNSGKPF